MNPLCRGIVRHQQVGNLTRADLAELDRMGVQIPRPQPHAENPAGQGPQLRPLTFRSNSHGLWVVGSNLRRYFRFRDLIKIDRTRDREFLRSMGIRVRVTHSSQPQIVIELPNDGWIDYTRRTKARPVRSTFLAFEQCRRNVWNLIQRVKA